MFRCLLHASNPRVHLQEDGCIYRYSRLRSTHALLPTRLLTLKTGKAVPLQARRGPECSRKLRFLHFVTTAQDGGKLSALRTGHFYPQEIVLVLISVRGWVEPRVIVHSEGFYVNENPLTPAGIESVTFRFVALCYRSLLRLLILIHVNPTRPQLYIQPFYWRRTLGFEICRRHKKFKLKY